VLQAGRFPFRFPTLFDVSVGLIPPAAFSTFDQLGKHTLDDLGTGGKAGQ
jgi:hypothetical protein